MEYLEWIEIPAGKFWMGDDNGHQEEKPCHLIDLPTYWIAKTPITNAQYLQFIEATHANMPTHWENGAIPSGKENHPVSLVSWPDAVAFASWVGGKIGQTVLLPSDAEWEKAARGGLMLPSGKNPLPKRNYPWGNVFDEAKCNMKASGIEETTPVGNYPYGASPYGVLDMAG
ncbi:MAG: SUMF1/EgtB/PvdO family nonheme iron enzyme, partial [Chloroflexi bacterium]|nr:SUMF1/EgtB/PvdO family nonheme iron enzyme [Chloroflexota bacterium]